MKSTTKKILSVPSLTSESERNDLASPRWLLCGLLLAVLIAYAGLYGNLGSVGIATADTQPKVMNNFRAVFVTTPNIEVAKKIAHGLVSNKLAACVNIIPQITSVYEWEGKINEDSELLLMIKTQSEKIPQIDEFVKQNHPYTVPEVIAVPIDQGSEKYLQWIKETIGGPSSS